MRLRWLAASTLTRASTAAMLVDNGGVVIPEGLAEQVDAERGEGRGLREGVEESDARSGFVSFNEGADEFVEFQRAGGGDDGDELGELLGGKRRGGEGVGGGGAVAAGRLFIEQRRG